MKKILDNKRFPYAIISFFSLLTLIPAGFLIVITLKQLRATGFNGITPQELEAILNKKITDWVILFPFIVGLIVWTTTATLTVHYVSKNRIGMGFGVLTLLLGGVGLHLIGWAVKEITDHFRSKKQKGVKFKHGVHFLLGSLVLMFFIPLTTTFYSKKVVAPVEGHSIAMSLDRKNPNIIEIFSDGLFRRAHVYPMSQSQDLKDFTIYNKYMTVSGSTYSTIPSIWGDFEKYNIYKIQQDNPEEKDYVSLVQRKTFMETFMRHMTQETDPNGIYENNTNIINPINITNKEGYTVNTSGSSREIMRRQPKWNVTNWSGARDSLGFGISKYSPDAASYRWLNRNMHASKDGQPARIFITDLITHPPMMNKADGSFTTGAEVRTDQWKLVRSNLINLTKALKKIKDPKTGITAYDNTMIIMYGDHKDHRYPVKNKTGLDNYAVEGESLLVMKYPFQQQQAANISNRVVYSPQINAIMKDFIENKNPDFIKTNNMFAPNSAHWAFSDDGDLYQVKYGKNKNYNSSWSDKESWEHLEPKESLNPVLEKDGSYKVIPRAKIKDILSALSKEVYHV
ncbi:hypothetical protein [Mycoplasma todarodis]|uniref:Uncharacterized protein n=1 Tax=Mycoplasma todarodis TaxID=1937191 RepID=A0A4R0XUN7_9MOLU|nr:hypothetical protein [Mycoplasma todarodis]TCG10601.1 hypothetical protein C4B25_03605 [Mycoplasma todarodis]